MCAGGKTLGRRNIRTVCLRVGSWIDAPGLACSVFITHAHLVWFLCLGRAGSCSLAVCRGTVYVGVQGAGIVGRLTRYAGFVRILGL